MLCVADGFSYFWFCLFILISLLVSNCDKSTAYVALITHRGLITNFSNSIGAFHSFCSSSLALVLARNFIAHVC